LIYIDLDGTVADFNRRAKELIGEDFVEGDKRLWMVISKHENFFQELEPLPDAFILWDYVKKHNPSILTALPYDKTLPLARQHKIEWVAKHFGSDVPVLFGPYAIDKQKHLKPGDFLVDDSVMNIAQASSVGAIGICHKDAATSIKCLKYFGV
jgi:hypothetical protein